jgi:hypothetical protein
MKRTVLLALAALLLLVLATASVAQPPWPSDPSRLGYVDFLYTGHDQESAGTGGFVEATAGCYTGSYNGYAVVYRAGATGDLAWGDCWLDPTTERARNIKLKFLDTVALDESFVVYGQNNGGKWRKIFTYTDVDDGQWHDEHTITRVPNIKGDKNVWIRIELTNTADANLDYACGNLAIDWVAFHNTR